MNRWQDITDMEVNEGTIMLVDEGYLAKIPFTGSIRLLEQHCRLAYRPLNRLLLMAVQ